MPDPTADPGAVGAPNGLDIHAPDFARDPYPTYETLRERCPVAHSEHHGGFWLLTRYEDVRQAALDWRTYTSSVVGVTAIPVITQRTEPQLPIEMDPPLHNRYRALVNPVFSQKRIETMGATVEAIAAELIADLLARRQGDLVADYAVPISVRTLAALTNLPLEDSGLWINWIRRMFDVRDREGGMRASREFGSYIDALITDRRHKPADDFVSRLIASEVEGQRLTDRELHSFLTVVFGAGFETTADAISVMLHWLAENPGQRDRLIAEPHLIPGAVEEFLRYSTPIQIFGRNASRDIELHGTAIAGGAIVALGFGAANRDPAIFPDPERCLLDRTPNRHLAFGAGAHLCLGAPVARLELRVTLEQFLRALPGYTVQQGGVVWKTRGDRRGIASLPFRL